MTTASLTTNEKTINAAMALVVTTIVITHHQRRRNPFRGGSGVSGGDDSPCTIVSGLFTLAISLVVVAAALTLALRAAKPATRDDEDDISQWRRVRSGVLLVTLLTALGVVVALVLLVAGAIILTGLRTAVQ